MVHTMLYCLTPLSSSHTDIDENPAESQKVGSSKDPNYNGKNAWDLVRLFTGRIKKPGCNCDRRGSRTAVWLVARSAGAAAIIAFILWLSRLGGE